MRSGEKKRGRGGGGGVGMTQHNHIFGTIILSGHCQASHVTQNELNAIHPVSDV